MVKEIFYKIAVFFDMLKDKLVSLFIKLLVLMLAITIIHNVLKMGEISTKYLGDYKNLYEVYDKKMMNIYVTGSGEETIVILPGFGSQFPIIQYKTIVDGLKQNYRVVVVEYFGYGFSMSQNRERTNENIAHEIKTSLEKAGVYENYTLVAHSSANVYATYFANKYPELVNGIVAIDGTYAKEIDDRYYDSKLTNDVRNIKINGVIELTGLQRILSYVKEDMFYIDDMRANPSVFTEGDIKVYKNRIGSSTLTMTMLREIDKMKDNMTEIKDYKYSTYLPVLSILASDTVKEYETAKENGAEMDLQELANTPITNSDIQKVVLIEGDHMLQFSNTSELLNQINQFLTTY